jgi:lipopolysaccharide transport system ATP-binding protein
MEPVIKIENLGKKYILNHRVQEKYVALRDVLTEKAKSIVRPRKAHFHSEREEFWALKDISFEVNRGDRVGIIGRNGAGKSTLLKILSQITEPTTGRAVINGNVVSLLEVGTGFHPELTGRENIFLNGAILGMNKKEIEKKFDEIVAFSEVEKFLDTPVKRYSSGMYVKLAFAVAAHLEPDVLIVDEVLAVGDMAFQKKCLGKMEEVSGQGRTVLFVSHNMQAVQKLCKTGILLKQGSIIANGGIDSVVNKYLETNDVSQAVYDLPVQENSKEIQGYATRIQIEDVNGNLLSEVPIGKRWQVRVFFTLNKNVEHFIVAMGLCNSLDAPVRTIYSTPGLRPAGNYEAVFTSDNILMAADIYSIVIGLSSYENSFYYKEHAAALHISELSELSGDERIVRVSSVGLILNPIDVVINKLG